MAVTTLSVVVQGVGLIGPGLVSWAAAQAVLQGSMACQPVASVVPPSQRLPAAERRRAGTAIKIAMAVADAACADAGVDPQTLGSVFTSSSGDGTNCHTLCETLASPNPADRLVSPTRFTNSVHNAPAGYWHIAVGSRAASTSLCAFDASFGAGLIAALTQVHAARAPLLLVASDTPYPEPLHTLRRLPDTLGVALVLAPEPVPGLQPATGATLRVALCPADQAPPETPCREAALETLRQQIPAARALPLLEALARGVAATVVIAAAPPLVLVIDVVPA
ncbi:beta-ketoacyl synthase chain length factor [Sphaerotilus sp.]|uniref:beta-ketoacyl synthase chain length factor n=1 Tax=Sphaerotilus sp. TaxID=2093942 RepID=UPI0034E1AF38